MAIANCKDNELLNPLSLFELRTLFKKLNKPVFVRSSFSITYQAIKALAAARHVLSTTRVTATLKDCHKCLPDGFIGTISTSRISSKQPLSRVSRACQVTSPMPLVQYCPNHRLKTNVDFQVCRSNLLKAAPV